MASDFSVRHAAHIIRSGGIIAYPTDTIYGLGCDPYNARAVYNINRLKQRPLNKQFILLASDITQIKPLIISSDAQDNLITQATEPTSWVIDANPETPTWLTDKQNTVTIRISENNTVKRLCEMLGHAIISTSANPPGKAPARNSLELHHYFHNHVHKILASQQKLTGRPSKIIRLCDNHIIRH
jgi:L-threonylcarbamoyladenylate synthase